MEKLYSSKTALKEYGGGCIIPRRDTHLLQLYAYLQKLILILAEPLLYSLTEPLGFGRTQFKNDWSRLFGLIWSNVGFPFFPDFHLPGNDKFSKKFPELDDFAICFDFQLFRSNF